MNWTLPSAAAARLVVREPDMPSKRDTRHRDIGGTHRAMSRYYMLKHRIEHSGENPKSACYAGVELRCSKEEFIAWFIARDFAGCSVDRIDKDGHYELGNMQVIPLAENIAKDKVIARGGISRCYSCKRQKPLDDFVRDRRRLNGHSTICKPCESQRRRAV